MRVFTKLMCACLLTTLSCTIAFSQAKKGSSMNPNGLAGQNKTKADVSATMGFVNSLSGPKALFDLLFEFPVITTGSAGVETDGQNFFVARWNADLFYKYSMTGTLLDSFAISGVTAIRDLAYDGQYFYGGANSNIIYKMDFTTHTLISTITLPAAITVRHIAYDPVNNGLWCGNWSTDFSLVDLNGNVLNTIPATTHLQTDIYGSAYDNYTPGGPYLWLYRQTSANANDLEQINLTTGISTGVTLDVTTVVSGLTADNSAGGLGIYENPITHKAILFGLAQNAKVWGLELKDLQVFQDDLGITAITNPVSTDTLTASDSIKVTIRNYDTIAHTNIPVNYVIDGGAVVHDTLFATIPTGTSVNFTFEQPYDFSIPGHEYQIVAYTSFVGDANNINDTVTMTVSNQWDIASLSIDMAAIVGVGSNTPLATVKNNSTMSTTFNVTMNITDGYTSTKTVTNLMPGASYQVTFDQWTATLGTYDVEVYTTLLADSLHANDTISQSVDVQVLVKAYGYVAYDPATTGALPAGPAYTYLQTPQNVVSLADQSSLNFISSGTWGPLNKWYGVVYDDNDLISIDTLTGSRTVIGNIGVNINGLTFDPVANTLYGVSFDGANSVLYKINAGSGYPTLIGNVAPVTMINLACSPTGQLYAVSVDDDNFYSVDKTTGLGTIIGPVGFDAAYAQDMEFDQHTGVCYLAAYNNTSGMGELRIVNVANGSTTLINAFLHGIEMTSFAIPYNYPTPSWDASVISYVSIPSACDLGTESLSIEVMNFGVNAIVDLPVAYTVNGGAPVLDTISGTINSGQTMAFTFAVPIDLSTDGDYNIVVYHSLSSDVNLGNDTLKFAVTNVAPKTIPYTMGFEPTDDFLGTKIIDNNSDGYTWYLATTGGNTNPYCMEYSYNVNSAADDWFISSCINLEAGKSYNLMYYYKAYSADYAEKLMVFLGNDNTVAALTTLIDDKANIVNTTYNMSNVTFTVPASGTYYMGWKCYSNADMWNLFVDDISITDATGVEENNVNLHVMVMPNPAIDQFTILTSENGSMITISNALGMIVYNQKINDNKTVINTSGFQSGIYFVKVETQNGIQLQKIMINK